jgi:hypothetical protein
MVCEVMRRTGGGLAVLAFGLIPLVAARSSPGNSPMATAGGTVQPASGLEPIFRYRGNRQYVITYYDNGNAP